MKLFLDSADIESVKRAHETGLLDGVTTNPSHIAQTGKKFFDTINEICNVVSCPVSVEVMAEDAHGMIEEAQKIASLAPNINVKIPMTIEGLKAVPVLERDKDIRVNLTMVFSSTQCLLAMKAGASFVSIVLSRLDAIAGESFVLVEDAVTIKQNYGFDSEVLAGSVKTQNHVITAFRAGVDIVTVPEALFFQMFRHPLTDSALKTFKQDWKKVPE